MAETTLDASKIASAIVKQAQGFEDKKDYPKAILFYKEALKYDPNNKEAKLGLARCESELLRLRGMKAYIRATTETESIEDYETAISYWERLIATYPDSPQAKDIIRDGDLAKAYHHLAKIYHSLGNYLKAIEYYGKAYDLYLKSSYKKYMAENVAKSQNEALANLEPKGGLPPYLLQFLIAARKTDRERSGEKAEGDKKPGETTPEQAKGKEGPPTEVEEKTLRTFPDGSSLVRINPYLNHEGLSGLGKLLGIPLNKKEECFGSLLPGGPDEAAGVYWRQTIGELFGDKNADYIGGRKLGPGNYELLFYSNGRFYLVNAKIEGKDVPILSPTRIVGPSPKQVVFTFKELQSNDLAVVGLKCVPKG